MKYNVWGHELDLEGRGYFSFVVGEVHNDVYDVRRVPFQNGDVVLDIGAHIGVFSIALAKEHPEISIVAYEPVPETFAFLERNIKANGITNIKAVNRAVGGSHSVMELQHNPDKSYASSAFYTQNVAGTQKINVTCDDINTVLLHYPKVKFVKMDCEGAEWDIIEKCNHLDRVEYMSLERHLINHSEAEKEGMIKRLKSNFSWRNLRMHDVEKEIAEGICLAAS